MKKNSISVKQVLISIITTGIFTFGLTACSDETLNNEAADGGIAPIELSSGCGLENLEQHSYAVPYMVTAKGDWMINFKFKQGRQICYAHPSEGHGPQEVKICVLDNWTDERRTGEMTITDSENPQQPQVVKLEQKCNLDNGITRGEGGSFVIPDKGNRIYGVGYGFNMYKPLSKAVSLSPLIKVERLKDMDKVFITEGVEMDDAFTVVTGSTLHELTNNFTAKASASAKGFGFDGEVSAAFKRKDFNQSKNEYALCTVDIKKTATSIVANMDSIRLNYLTDEAYQNINGVAFEGEDDKEGRKMDEEPLYPSTPEGLYELVKTYGTHLVVRSEMGGRLTFASTVDVSKIEGNYDINAFAKLSYENSFLNASGNVSDEYKNSWNKNSKYVNTVIKAYGGTQETAGKAASGKVTHIIEWKASLNDVGNCKLVGVTKLIPLWELVNPNEENGEQRSEDIRNFIENELYGMMQKEAKRAIYTVGTIAHISSIPTFPGIDEIQDGKQNDGMKNLNDNAKQAANHSTLVKDVYMSGLHVARICNEFLPQINKEERVTVIYPVIENCVKYNLGYWIGDENRKPCRVCCTDNRVSVSELINETVGKKTEIYLRGSCFYSENKDSAVLANEKIGETEIEDAYMRGTYVNELGKDAPYNYPIVKIFGRIWTRDYYDERVPSTDVKTEISHGWYTKGSNLDFRVNHWRLANIDDYQNMLNGLKDGEITLPASVMWNSEKSYYKAKDLTGFSAEWYGDRYVNKNKEFKMYNNSMSIYLTKSADGKEFGYVNIMGSGAVEIVKNFTENLAMRVRLAIPVSKQK